MISEAFICEKTRQSRGELQFACRRNYDTSSSHRDSNTWSRQLILRMSHFRLIQVDKPSVDFGFVGEKIHHQQVHIAVFEHIGEFLVHQPELLIACVPSDLHYKHWRLPCPLYR